MKSAVKKSVSFVLALLMVFALMSTSFAIPKYGDSADGKTKTITGYKSTGDEKGILTLESVLNVPAAGIQLVFTSVSKDAFNADLGTLSNKEKEFLKSLTEITVQEGIKEIGETAFANLPNLKKVTFEGETVLASKAFANCPALEEVIFEKGSEIGDKAFAGCSALAKLTFGANTKLSETAFDGASALSEIALGDGAKMIGGASALKNSAFVKNCPVDFVMMGSTLVYYKGNDEEVTIPLNVTAIGDSAFAGNKQLRKINITKYVDTLADNAFYGCKNLKTVEFARYGKIENIGKDVFTDTPYFDNFEGDFFTVGTVLIKYLGSESYVTIPNTITSIADECFLDRYASKNPDGYTWVVSSILVPASVEKIGENCFALAQLENGTYYIPKLYAYNGTKAMELLDEAGYDTVTMPAIGDVDANGILQTEDARRALRLAVKLDLAKDPMFTKAADVNFDGVITPADARTILRLAIGLENYTAKDLLFMPATDLEILMAYTAALDNAALYNAGYKKTVTNTEVAHDMCTAASINFYGDLSKKGFTNSDTTYAANTQAALDNLDMCRLISDKGIASASCILDETGKYTINIKFNDVLDNDGTSDITKVFPVKTRNYYADAYKGQSWWNGTRESNSLTKYDLTYTNPTIKAVIDKNTNQLQEITLSVGYHFAIDGRVNGLAISSHMWETGDATFDRLDVVKYSKFNYEPSFDKN